MTEDPVPAVLRVAAVLEHLGIDYWVGGSVASSIHGEPRSTHDVDLVVEMDPEQVDGLVEALIPDYHVDREFVREAVRRRDSFQFVERSGYNRIDVFVKKDQPFANEQKRRRVRHVIDSGSGAAIWVSSAEDIVLQKLSWYRSGGEVSGRQWRDVLGVLKSNPGLDRRYLAQWAAEIGVSDLLSRVLVGAGLEPGSAS